MQLARLSLCAILIATPALAQERTPASSEDVKALARADAAFACDLYQAVRSEPGNLFLSPFSVSQALGLAYLGARGETAAEFERVLHVELEPSVWHAARGGLARALATRGANARGRDGQPFRLRVADRAWAQRGARLEPDYVGQLQAGYAAELGRVDFAGDTEAARETINAWIAEQTEDRIPHLLEPGDVKPATRLVLTNAIYFNAAWQDAFEVAATRDEAFQREGAGAVRAPFMVQTSTLRHARGEGYQAVELPYQGREVSMLIVVPDAGTFAAFEAGLDAERLAGVLGTEGSWGQVELHLPRFEARSRLTLGQALQGLGLERACQFGQADFSGIDGTRELFVGRVIHEAFVKVDEAGTEAAAATAVDMDAGGMPEEPTVVRVDRPFLYLIRDRETGAVLFMGRVRDPSVALE